MNTCSCWPTLIWSSCTARRCPERLRRHESGRRLVLPPPKFCQVLYIISPCFITRRGHSNGMEEFHINSGVIVASMLLRWEIGCGVNISIETLTKRRLRELGFNSILLKWSLKKYNCFTQQTGIYITPCSRNVRFESLLGRRICLYWLFLYCTSAGFCHHSTFTYATTNTI